MIIFLCTVWLVGATSPVEYRVPDYYWSWQAYSNSLNVRWLDDEDVLHRTIWAAGTWRTVECVASDGPAPYPEPVILPYERTETFNPRDIEK